jgi:hypothetical protein
MKIYRKLFTETNPEVDTTVSDREPRSHTGLCGALVWEREDAAPITLGLMTGEGR